MLSNHQRIKRNNIIFRCQASALIIKTYIDAKTFFSIAIEIPDYTMVLSKIRIVYFNKSAWTDLFAFVAHCVQIAICGILIVRNF